MSRSLALLVLVAACRGGDPKCDAETTSNCLLTADSGLTAAGTTTTTTDVGNNVRLDSFPPVVVASDPPSGSLGVPASTATLSIQYSRPMGAGYAWVQVNPDLYPEAAAAGWVDLVENELTGVVLEEDHAYLLWANSPYGVYESFTDSDGTVALPWPFVFHTGSDPAGLEGLPCAVVDSTPRAGVEDVDPNLSEISVTFSVPVDPASDGWSRVNPKTWAEPGENVFDGATVTAPVSLEPGTTYAFRVNEGGIGFRHAAPSGVPCAEWLLTFRTADP